MNGFDLMLLTIFSMSNGTDSSTNKSRIGISPNRYNWELDLSEMKVSLADTHSDIRNKNIPNTLRVTTWEDPPFSWTNKTGDRYVGNGYAFILFDTIVAHLNLTYEIIKPSTSLLENEPDGIFKLLHNKEVDVAVAFLPIFQDMRQNVSFGSILGYTDVTVLLKRPKVSAVGSGLLAPFDTTVWLCILISLTVIGPIIYFFTSYRSHLFGNSNIDKYTFTACAWFTYGALLKQGSPSSPVYDSNRLLFATWWLFITLITSFYTANLTAFLTLSEFTLPIKSIQDIVSTKTKWAAQEKHIVQYAMKTNNAGKLAELRLSEELGIGQFVKIPFNNKMTKIMNIIEHDKIFLGEKNLIDKIIHDDYLRKTNMNVEEKKRCTLVMMPQNIYRQNRAFAYQLDSPVQNLIDKKLLHLTETGIIKHLEAVEMPAMRYCPLNLQSKERQLSNDDLSLTYKVIASGFAIAIIIFIIEVFQRWSKFKFCLCCKKSCFTCQKRVKRSQQLRPKILSPPTIPFSVVLPKAAPTYDSLAYNPKIAKRHVINGRDYWVITEKNGYKRLVPIRSPSAILFQYTT